VIVAYTARQHAEVAARGATWALISSLPHFLHQLLSPQRSAKPTKRSAAWGAVAKWSAPQRGGRGPTYGSRTLRRWPSHDEVATRPLAGHRFAVRQTETELTTEWITLHA